MVAGAVLLASALAPCLLASVPLLAKITIVKSAGALSCFILAKHMPRGRDYLAREISQWFQSQPKNAKAEAQQILNILKEKDLSRPFKLRIPNYLNITSLPNILQNCTELSCEGCTSLKTLPALPACTFLKCSDCSSLQTLPPALLACTTLSCNNCPSLKTLSAVPICSWVECRNCTSLRALPDLPNFTWLYCFGCTSLKLPNPPNSDWKYFKHTQAHHLHKN